MILDPRLVPWGDVVPGVGVAVLIAAIAFFMWKWRLIALITLTLAPVAGWTVTIWNLRGSLPEIPPVDATQWVFYFAIAAVIIAAATLLLSRNRWWPTAALLISVAFIAAIWATLVKAVAVPDETGTSMLQPALFLAWLGCLAAMDVRRKAELLSAAYAPWLVGLLTASISLALTGMASGSTLALSMCLAALPSAIVVLTRSATTNNPTIRHFGPLTGGSTLAADDRDRAGTTRPERAPQLQAVTLPLAFTLPLFMLSGSLYASTPWIVTCLVLLAPLLGLVTVRLVIIWNSRRRRRSDTALRYRSWRTELLAIAIALVASAIPAGIAAYQVISAAAAEESYY